MKGSRAQGRTELRADGGEHARLILRRSDEVRRGVQRHLLQRLPRLVRSRPRARPCSPIGTCARIGAPAALREFDRGRREALLLSPRAPRAPAPRHARAARLHRYLAQPHPRPCPPLALALGAIHPLTLALGAISPLALALGAISPLALALALAPAPALALLAPRRTALERQPQQVRRVRRPHPHLSTRPRAPPAPARAARAAPRRVREEPELPTREAPVRAPWSHSLLPGKRLLLVRHLRPDLRSQNRTGGAGAGTRGWRSCGGGGAVGDGRRLRAHGAGLRGACGASREHGAGRERSGGAGGAPRRARWR